MYTGIIHHQAKVGGIKKQEGGNVLLVFTVPVKVRKRLKVDDSVSIEGVCLTVIKLGVRSFSVEVIPETLRRTTLGSLSLGQSVNLELSLRANDTLGGHFVMGHVDGLGTTTKLRKEGGSLRVTIKTPKELMRFIAMKGSIAVSGVSLTVAEVTNASFTVALIPHTLKMTTLGALKKDMELNLEVDMIARSVVRFLEGHSK